MNRHVISTLCLLALLLLPAARSTSPSGTTYKEVYSLINSGGGRSSSQTYRTCDRVESFCSPTLDQKSTTYSVKDVFQIKAGPAAPAAISKWQLYR